MAIAMATIATAFTIGAYWLRENVLAWMAAPFWMLAGGHFYLASTSTTDIFNITGFLMVFGMTIATAVSVFMRRDKEDQADISAVEEDENSKSDEAKGKKDVYIAVTRKMRRRR